MRARRPPRDARPFVAVFLCAILGCGLASVEAWPFTAWRLFSTVRTDEQLTVLVVFVNWRVIVGGLRARLGPGRARRATRAA